MEIWFESMVGTLGKLWRVNRRRLSPEVKDAFASLLLAIRLEYLPDLCLDTSSNIGRARYDVRGISELLRHIATRQNGDGMASADSGFSLPLRSEAAEFVAGVSHHPVDTTHGDVPLVLDTLVDGIRDYANNSYSDEQRHAEWKDACLDARLELHVAVPGACFAETLCNILKDIPSDIDKITDSMLDRVVLKADSLHPHFGDDHVADEGTSPPAAEVDDKHGKESDGSSDVAPITADRLLSGAEKVITGPEAHRRFGKATNEVDALLALCV